MSMIGPSTFGAAVVLVLAIGVAFGGGAAAGSPPHAFAVDKKAVKTSVVLIESGSLTS
jgi:hypothetical protein